MHLVAFSPVILVTKVPSGQHRYMKTSKNKKATDINIICKKIISSNLSIKSHLTY
jgi:hypothetical protein